MAKSKNILITGASTGIGYDLAKVFVGNGYTVFGSVRKQKDADRLLEDLGESFRPLLFDVTDHEAIDQAAAQLEKEIGDQGLAGLINNAGIALGGPFVDLKIDEYRYQFEVNVFGLIKVTQAFLPLLGAKETPSFDPGRIVQISSIAGKHGMPFMSPYSGSKHALEGITESLRKELLFYGIDVILIEPGPIKTPIWEKGASEAVEERFKKSVFYPALQTFQKRFVAKAVKDAWTSERAARIIFNAFEASRPKTRYLIVPGKFKNWTLPRLMPTRTVDKFLGKALGLMK
ncbi:MAG: SDR family oxidoreductase [Ekhidna sp.]|uniref:SDR family oxidoreductase n=1 Tax=Ekhidna sp. TaxID=2608089 RepID=UPI0032EC63CA